MCACLNCIFFFPAAMYDTDWLHLYTSNPLITNPDLLPVGTRINTGVIYEVRKVFFFWTHETR